jgi:DNA-directed RNA polymerase specialized sigma subunit
MSKKEVEQLKAKIYQQVDKLEDETALQLLEEAVAAYSTTSKKDIVDELTAEQQLRLKESIQQAKDGKTISNDEVKQKAKEWLSK